VICNVQVAKYGKLVYEMYMLPNMTTTFSYEY